MTDQLWCTLYQLGDLFVELTSTGTVTIWRGGRDWGEKIVLRDPDELTWMIERMRESVHDSE